MAENDWEGWKILTDLSLRHLGEFAVAVSGVATELFLNAKELVVLGHTVGTALVLQRRPPMMRA